MDQPPRRRPPGRGGKRVLNSDVTPERIGEEKLTEPVESGLLGPVKSVSRTDASTTVADAPDGDVAGIPANYTEAKAGSYTLPDPLENVPDAKTWNEKRRAEIVRLFEENQFGRSPGRPADLSFEVFEQSAPAFDGKAVRRQVTVYFSKDQAGPKMELLLYVPAAARQPVPVLLNIGFSANNIVADDPGVKQGMAWNKEQNTRVPAVPNAKAFGCVDVRAVIERGLGFATVNYADIEPDVPNGLEHGVRALYPKPGPDEWGAIAAGPGLSRASIT